MPPACLCFYGDVMKITETAIRRRRLYLLRLDNGTEYTVDRQTFDESPYRVGEEITEEQLDTLLQRSQYNRARERALYLLGLRDYACGELQKKLYTEAPPAIAAAVIVRLQEVGLLDDARYARRLARHLMEQKQYPRRRIEQELRQRGMDAYIIADAMAELDGDDLQQALALLQKKYYNKLDTPEDRRKVMHALARRGFSYGAIHGAMERMQVPDDEEIDAWQ